MNDPKKNKPPFKSKNTVRSSQQGWQSISGWYDECVGKEGHFYHRELILPFLSQRLNLKNIKSVLDLGCGQGIFERVVNPSSRYLGVDAAPTLLKSAQQASQHTLHSFECKDLSTSQDFNEHFDLAIFLLSLQNIPNPQIAVQTAIRHLKNEGQLVIVMNHPCFRIPRHSEWVDQPKRGTLARQLHSYMSPLSIPIQTHPGKAGQQDLASTSYHYSLTEIFSWINQNGFKVAELDELISPKTSEGGKAATENRARKEFPLFLYLLASK
jgi:SAM-dependent methyltransferase